MAEIEKSLPNEAEKKLKMFKDKVVEDIKEEPKEVEVMETPDGGAEISFDPNAVLYRQSHHFQKFSRIIR